MAHLERCPKGSGALRGSKRSLLSILDVYRWLLFWGSFFIEKEGPSELNQFLHSRPCDLSSLLCHSGLSSFLFPLCLLFPLPWPTWRGAQKGPGLSGAQKGHFCYSVYVTRWSLFGGISFLEKEGPSELNKFLHSCPAIFPLFFVIAQILNVQVQILIVQVQMFGLDATRLLTVAPRIYRYLRGFIDIYLILPFRRVLS